MDFLNKAFAQISELFRSMTPGARITSALLLGVVVVSLGFLIKQQTGGPSDYLLAGEDFSPADVQAMAGALGQAKLEYEIEGSRIRIPRGRQGDYLGALADAGALPADFATILQKSLEQGIWASGPQREASFKVAMQKVLSMAIRGMKGVSDATVIYDVKTKPGWDRETVATATVMVRPVGTHPLEERQVRLIRHLVGASVAGLSPGVVTVTDENGGIFPATGDADASTEANDRYFEMVTQQENHLHDKFMNLLRMIPGVQVSVHVELDQTKEKSERTVKYDAKTSVSVESEENNLEESRETPAPAGPPGIASNGASNSGAELASRSGSTNTISKTGSRQLTSPGGSEVVTETVGMTPTRVRVSVLVPQSHYAKVWRKKNAIDDPEQKPDANSLIEIEKDEKNYIQRTLVAQIPAPVNTNVDPIKEITVETYVDYVEEKLPEPEFSDTAMAWLGQYGGAVGMSMVGMFGLLMLRSMVRSSGAPRESESAEPALSVAAPPEEEAEAKQATEAKRTLKRRSAGGPSLREELAEMVREDPDVAANILRSWIGVAK